MAARDVKGHGLDFLLANEAAPRTIADTRDLNM